MATGKYPFDYFANPKIDKPLEQIYADINGYTQEILSQDTHLYGQVEHVVVLPPLYWDGKFIKGIMHGNGMDVTLQEVPETAEFFHTIADAYCGAYAWTSRSDALFSVYPNPHREAWFRESHPHQAHQMLLPLHTADHINDKFFYPKPVPEKDIDLLMIARQDPAKNFPFLAQCLKAYRKKYPERSIKVTLVDAFGTDVNLSWLRFSKQIYREVESILIHPMDYFDFYANSLSPQQLPDLYSRAKLVILPSLVEGKNRVIYEAMLCNTPVVVFQELNQYIRGEAEILPPGGGLYAPFDPEGWADTIHQALSNLGEFNPRHQYLSGFSGRNLFFNQCLNSFPYYREHLPDFESDRDHTDNLWLDTAMLYNYQLSLQAFLYHPDPWLFPFRAQGVEHLKRVMSHYREHFK
jgi:glycosyltransferase involved in cell wall biosynthesis